MGKKIFVYHDYSCFCYIFFYSEGKKLKRKKRKWKKENNDSKLSVYHYCPYFCQPLFFFSCGGNLKIKNSIVKKIC